MTNQLNGGTTMSSEKGTASDAEILNQIRQLAAGISDERTRRIIQNTTGALELNPQPIPPGVLRSLLEAVALNPQPLPPSSVDETDTANR
jgi:hypothetical protein